MGKATGHARYADDLVFPGMLHSADDPLDDSRGALTGFRLQFDPSGFTIVNYRDLPRRPQCDRLIEEDSMPRERDIRHVAEAATVLAHEDKERLSAPA